MNYLCVGPSEGPLSSRSLDTVAIGWFLRYHVDFCGGTFVNSSASNRTTSTDDRDSLAHRPTPHGMQHRAQRRSRTHRYSARATLIASSLSINARHIALSDCPSPTRSPLVTSLHTTGRTPTITQIGRTHTHGHAHTNTPSPTMHPSSIHSVHVLPSRRRQRGGLW